MLTQYAATLLDELKSAPRTPLAMMMLADAAKLEGRVGRRRGIACDVLLFVTGDVRFVPLVGGCAKYEFGKNCGVSSLGEDVSSMCEGIEDEKFWCYRK